MAKIRIEIEPSDVGRWITTEYVDSEPAKVLLVGIKESNGSPDTYDVFDPSLEDETGIHNVEANQITAVHEYAQ